MNELIKEMKNGTIHFTKIPTTLEELKQLDLTNEFISACAVILALNAFENNEVAGKEMFEYMNGPEDASAFDYNFIKEQLKQYPYVMRSYFNGTSVDNNYVVSEFSITVKEDANSRNEDGYVKLWVKSSGADSVRSITLRQKKSTGEWFLFSDSYRGLLSGIRVPVAQDKWA